MHLGEKVRAAANSRIPTKAVGLIISCRTARICRQRAAGIMPGASIVFVKDDVARCCGKSCKVVLTAVLIKSDEGVCVYHYIHMTVITTLAYISLLSLAWQVRQIQAIVLTDSVLGNSI